ncbi:MAG: MIP/aquaporin family protein [Miltoncostaeaceae bacterium]
MQTPGWINDLRHPPPLDFHDGKQEWKRLLSEFVGTFFLVLVAAGAAMVMAQYPGTVTLEAAVVAPGLMVMAIIMFMGRVSGAHLNPGVSVAFALRGDFPWYRVPGYIVMQLLGAIAAAGLLRCSPTSRPRWVGHIRAPVPAPWRPLPPRPCSPLAW